MKTFFKLLPTIVVGLILGVLGLLVGRYVFPEGKEEKTVITSRSILKEISAQGFLVTHTILSEEKVSQKIDKGSEWSNFWWGHEVESRATMQVSYGIDLTELTEDKIHIDEKAKTFCIVYSSPVIHSVSLIGEIEVEQKSGVLKKLFLQDDNKDYNLALELLNDEAKTGIAEIDGIEDSAKKQADSTVSFILSQAGYTVIDDCR